VTTTVAGVVLAAGAGSRFQAPGHEAGSDPGHKLRAPFRGRPVVSWVIDSVLEAGFNQVYVITGAVDLTDLLPAGVTEVHHAAWADGQSGSLLAAVAAAGSDGHGAIVVGLGDQPLVPASAWRSVGACAGAIVTATFEGERRPPVKLDRSVWSELPSEGDFGARTLIQQRPDLVCELPCRGNPVDIDTVEDLRLWS
jgi:molybdenum cofactor cytidylyltransferase